MKLIELFGTIEQFRTLGNHNLEGIAPIIDSFTAIVEAFKRKNDELLQYQANTFDRDFVEFNVGVSTVETELQRYIDKNFEVITNIDDSLKLLRKFKTILKRENLKNGPNGLTAKYTILFQNYGGEIQSVEDQYQRFKTMPPIVRNMPTVSGHTLSGCASSAYAFFNRGSLKLVAILALGLGLPPAAATPTLKPSALFDD